MSIRIDNGYKIVGPADTKWLFEFCERAAKGIRLAQKKEIKKLMALYLSMEFDLAAAAKRGLVTDDARPLRIDDDKGSVIQQVMTLIAERVFKASRSDIRDHEFDMSVSLSIFRPILSKGDECFPAMLFATRPALIEEWRLNEEVHDFHYQTIEERPEEISEAEWEFRSITWEKAMPHGRPPVECALSFQLSEAMAPFGLRDQMAEILEWVPAYDFRIRTLARLIASHEKSEEIMGDRIAEDFPLQERIRMSHDIAGWLHGNMAEIVKEKTPIIQEFLVEQLSLDRVLHPMNQAL